ncbi:uncharacterized protein TNCV_174541 [Trichonephila clavipes]|nr:uncharacterized protein TNCV_174541 [Trichonephila clavipes]
MELLCVLNTPFLPRFAPRQYEIESPQVFQNPRETSGSSRKNNAAVGCLVLLKENDLPPCKWAMARILEVIYATDAANYEGLVKTIWLQFPDLPQIGGKIRRKAVGYAAEINASRITVRIVLRSSNIPLNNNKTIFIKRVRVPLVCACATTIHKSQGNTYSEIVYEYDRRQSQSLLYVALSRVTSIE